MLKFQVEGIKSFCDNISDIKINDPVKLKLNSKNKISNKAIGIYTLNNKKIGYAPFQYSENINLNFKIINIFLSKHEIIIGAEYNEINYLDIITLNDSIQLPITDELKKDLKLLKLKLEKLNYEIKNIDILYYDENFIDINIKTQDKDIIIYTITRKYYDDNILKYNEFYDNTLISYCIFVPFFIHRLEEYIKNNYKLIYSNKIQTNKICYNHKNKTYFYL